MGSSWGEREGADVAPGAWESDDHASGMAKLVLYAGWDETGCQV